MKNTSIALISITLTLACIAIAYLTSCADRTRWRLASAPADKLSAYYSMADYHQTPDEVGIDLIKRPTLPIEAFDEVWVIAKLKTDQVQADDETPGSGAMLALMPTEGREPEKVPLPLEHTDVRARIDAYIASVKVTQQFHNPYDSKIEAVYVFPLPQDAAINEFVMTIGDRRIRGIIREREEAERTYLEARAQGYRAALMTQERPNIFTQKVANIEPGKRIDVDIRYFNTLTYADGWYEFVFPMVVGPRFNPPHAKDPVRALPRRGQPAPATAGTNVHYLSPHERSGHDIALTVDVDPGVEIEQIESANHRVLTDGQTFTLASDDAIPNRDFVLRYRVAGDRIKSQLLTHRDDDGNEYFTLMVYPPAELASQPRHPMEMVFVLDCSGSMSGQPLNQAKDAIKHALNRLEPNDTFQIVRFSDRASAFGHEPVPATASNIDQARRYVNGLNADGGTMMINGIKAGLDFPHDDERLRIVCFMTDGYIGNEAEILAAMHERLGASRVFSFGVGSSPNRFLLERMAGLGRGAVGYVGLNDDGAAVMDAFFERASRPAMTDVTIDWNGMRVSEVSPSRPADLLVGRPIVLTGRYRGELPPTLNLTGRASGEPIESVIRVNTHEDNTARPALAGVWARKQIEVLSNARALSRHPDDGTADEIMRLALAHNLMSAYTAFVAVDGSEKTAGSFGTTVQQALPVPDGVRYDTTVR